MCLSRAHGAGLELCQCVADPFLHTQFLCLVHCTLNDYALFIAYCRLA